MLAARWRRPPRGSQDMSSTVGFKHSTVYFLRFLAKPENGRFYLSDMTSWKQGRIDLSKPTVSFLRFVAKPEKGRIDLSDTEYTARPFDSDRKVQNTTRKDRMNLSLLDSFI
jgi:hypothetical protein